MKKWQQCLISLEHQWHLHLYDSKAVPGFSIQCSAPHIHTVAVVWSILLWFICANHCLNLLKPLKGFFLARLPSRLNANNLFLIMDARFTRLNKRFLNSFHQKLYYYADLDDLQKVFRSNCKLQHKLSFIKPSFPGRFYQFFLLLFIYLFCNCKRTIFHIKQLKRLLNFLCKITKTLF